MRPHFKHHLKPLVLTVAAIWGVMIFNTAVAYPTTGLAGGYSNDLDHGLGVQCLNNEPTTITGSNTGFSGPFTLIIAELEERLNVKSPLTNHIESGAFDNGGSSELMSQLSSDNLSEAIIYANDGQFKGSMYNLSPTGNYLNSLGTAAIQQGADHFRSVCGDAYAASIHNGADLYIIYQFHFLSTTDKQKFDSMQYSFETFSPFTQAMQDQINSMHIRGNFHLLGYQVGGEPQYLPAAMGHNDTCDLSNLLPCNPISAINYLIGSDPNGFPNQFNSYGPDGQIPLNAAPVGLEQASYAALGPQFKSNSQLTPEMTAMRDKLGSLLQITQNYLQRGLYLQDALPGTYNYQVFQQKLATQVSNLEYNEQALQSAGANCFNDLSSCVDTATAALNHLKPLKKSAFIVPETLDVSIRINYQPSAEQLFVAVNTTDPKNQSFRGNEINPTPGTMPTNVLIGIDGQSIQMTQLNPTPTPTGNIIALYKGSYWGNNLYKGSVAYSNGQTGTWTAVLTPADTGTQ